MSFRMLFLAVLLVSSEAFGAPLTAYQNLTPAQRAQINNSGTFVKGNADDFWYALEVDPATGALPVTLSGGGGLGYDTNAGLVGANTLRGVQGGRQITSSILANLNAASTNITTSAYVQLIASTSAQITEICMANTTGSILKIATGASSSEVDRLYLPPSSSGCFDVFIAASTRISLEALDVTASTGYMLFEGLP